MSDKNHTPVPWAMGLSSSTHRNKQSQDITFRISTPDQLTFMGVPILTISARDDIPRDEDDDHIPDPREKFRRPVEEVRANAEFIVKAVNNHDELVRVLDALICVCSDDGSDQAIDDYILYEARPLLEGLKS